MNLLDMFRKSKKDQTLTASSQYLQESSEKNKMPSSMSLDVAYNVVGQAVTELVDVYKATINAATTEEDIKKFEDHIRSIAEALQIIGAKLFT